MRPFVPVIRKLFTGILLLCSAQAFAVAAPVTIIVDKTGRGNFRSIQAALNSLPMSSASVRTIIIKKGTYNEKIYIEKHNVVLAGEDREHTIITQAIARDEWRCLHNDDWGVATVNVDANDITFKNLTIINSYGFDSLNERQVNCPTDTAHPTKTINRFGHQMALRTMNATRLKAINCRFKSFAGDTVSPWNVADGLFYFKDCIMEGGVDFYCPRGWAYAENCTFICNTGTAAIWHDGSVHADSKSVLKNCTFLGFDGFSLGRYHKDAQFYLINCIFGANMANKDIYVAQSSPGIKWGRRVYYYNCHKQNGDYPWFADNLHTAAGSPRVDDINTRWVFGNRWNPLKN